MIYLARHSVHLSVFLKTFNAGTQKSFKNSKNSLKDLAKHARRTQATKMCQVPAFSAPKIQREESGEKVKHLPNLTHQVFSGCSQKLLLFNYLTINSQMSDSKNCSCSGLFTFLHAAASTSHPPESRNVRQAEERGSWVSSESVKTEP